MLTTSQTAVVLTALEENEPEIAVKLAKGLINGFMRDNEAALQTKGPEATLTDRKADPKLRLDVNPAWFRRGINGQSKLTLEGEEYLYGLFDEGHSIYSAAKRLGISYQGGKHRFSTWQRLVAEGKRPKANPQA